MKRFVIIANDKKDSKKIRTEIRAYHLDYINNNTFVNVKTAGPLLGANKDMKGSMLIIEANGIQEVNIFLENDPYNKAGLFEDIIIEEFLLVIDK